MYSFQTKFNAKVFWQPCVLVLLCIHYSQETQTPKRTKVHDFFFHQMKVHELDGRSIKIFQNLLQVIKKFKNLSRHSWTLWSLFARRCIQHFIWEKDAWVLFLEMDCDLNQITVTTAFMSCKRFYWPLNSETGI